MFKIQTPWSSKQANEISPFCEVGFSGGPALPGSERKLNKASAPNTVSLVGGSSPALTETSCARPRFTRGVLGQDIGGGSQSQSKHPTTTGLGHSIPAAAKDRHTSVVSVSSHRQHGVWLLTEASTVADALGAISLTPSCHSGRLGEYQVTEVHCRRRGRLVGTSVVHLSRFHCAVQLGDAWRRRVDHSC